MKKKLLVMLVLPLAAMAMVSCGGEKEDTTTEAPKTEATAEYKDGTFEAETKDADENGGKARVSVKIEGGKIASATYNEFTDKGDKRTDEGYNKMMKEKAGTSPSEYEVKIEEQVKEAQSADIDGVSGATSSSSKAKSLFAAALENAKEGKAEKVMVEVK